MGEMKETSPWPVIIFVYLGMVGFGYVVDKAPLSGILYIFSFLLFLPMMYTGYLYGLKGVVPITAGLFITYNVMITDVHHRILILFLLVLVPGILGVGLKEKWRFRHIFLLMTFVLFLGIFGLLYYMQERQGISIQSMIERIVDRLILEMNSTTNEIRRAGVQVKDSGKELSMNKEMILQSLPFSVMLQAAVQSFIYFMVARVFIKMMEGSEKVKRSLKPFSFSNIHLGKGYSWMFFITIIGWYLVESHPKYGLYSMVFMNIFFIFLYLFLIQGVSFTFFIAKRSILTNRIFSILILVVLLLVVRDIGIIVLSIIGFLDVIFNFRNIKLES